MKHLMKNICLTLGALAFVSACNAADTINTEPKAHKHSNLSKYPGKPQAGVEMNYTMDKSIEAGQALEVSMTFTTRQNVEDLTVVYSIDKKLEDASAKVTEVFGSRVAGEASNLNINLVPKQIGYYYINVFATITNNGMKRSRSFAIPVNVGNVDAKQYMKKMGEVKVDSTGQRIISMPASQPKK